MSHPVILAFLRKDKTAEFLWEQFSKLPYEKIIEIQNVDDQEYKIRRVHSKNTWINTETLLVFAAILLGVIFYHQAWVAATILGAFFLLSNALLLAYEHFTKKHDLLVNLYKGLVTRGEKLILVQCDPVNFEKFIKTIQRVQDEPVAFFSLVDGKPKESTNSKEMLPHPPETDDELVKQAKGLATNIFPISYKSHFSKDFLSHIKDLSDEYTSTYKQLNNFASYNENIQLSAEWLLDNAYTVKQSIGDVQKNLPENYFRELPFIDAGKYQGSPVIYPLASRIIAASDGRLTAENITLFLNAYQENKPLTMGELWAFPLILKIRLIECLVNLTDRILGRVKENQSADFWANRILNASRIDPEKLYTILSALSKEKPYPTAYFADQLMVQLTDTEANNSLLMGWLQRKVGDNLHDIIQVEQSKQTLEQTSIANVISSLRRLEQMNWREIFDDVSLVEKTLCKDPAHKYAEMDFATKDKYRHTVEKLARQSKMAEEKVAASTVSLAELQSTPFARHVGYFLLDKGKEILEADINYRPSGLKSFLASLKKHSAGIYVSACILFTVLIAAFFAYASGLSAASWTLAGGLLLLGLIPFSEIAIQLINYVIAHVIPPSLLPKMEYKDGLPEQYRTLVVVPTLLDSEQSIRHELEKVEIRYLANTDSQIAFGILSDFTDNKEEDHYEDSQLLKIAREGIQYLNTKYEGARFYLLHRDRKLNHHENCWMGWERKRGKLENLNSYLCGSEDTELDNFLHEGDASFLSGVAYVLTIDSDTQLPKNSIRRMVEALSHPLNVGYLDPVAKKLLRGYTIIQPRVSTNYLSANSTWFSKLFSDPSGIDPYTKSTSDVYQDLFDEGVYHGKGLYDYKLFHQVLSEKLPENRILSHDLLEGSYAKVAFASDIEVYDSFPETYALYAKRQNRWVRGDWQLLSWLGRTVPNAKNEREKNPLSLINRWKIFDNLRRSLIPVTALAGLLLSWFTPYYAAWALLVIVVMAFPIVHQIIDLAWITTTRKLNNIWSSFYNGVIKSIVTLAFLPHQAWINANAIGKALFRQYVSHSNLLQWTVSSAFTKKDHHSCLLQLGGIAIASIAAILFFDLDSVAGLSWKLPFLALWLVAPGIYWLLNLPYLRDKATAISRNSEEYLGVFSRKTWRYFDDFVNEETHYLPPDNYQEKLKVEVAYRTSPTNIGLYMMSAISAYRFGFITAQSLINRLGQTVATLKKLERYEGHFLNWYEIKNITPLLPKYVSTVDSGNLLASFWAAEELCKSLLHEPVLNAPDIISAINDNLNILKETAEKESSKDFSTYFNNLTRIAGSMGNSPLELKNGLEELQSETMRIIAIAGNSTDTPADTLYWLQKLQQLIDDNLVNFNQTVPWVSMLASPDAQKIVHMHPEGVNWKKAATAKFPTFENLLVRNVDGLIPFMGWLQTLSDEKLDGEASRWIKTFIEKVNHCFAFADQFKGNADQLVKELHDFSAEMNLAFLYVQERKLFSIGYNVSDNRLDSSCYDLLASEARLASFIAIAKGDVPLEHWWALGRPTTEAFGMTVVQSWGGTMFEYLMPVIWCKNFNDTLLDYACKTAVKCQIAYGNELGIPWGISESAYSRLDIHNIYQYRAFGVPYLGLKHGLEDDFVITPYSSALASMIDLPASIKNLKRLNQKGIMTGPYGFFEAIDYSMGSRPDGEQGIVIHTYMAHHLGMSICALCNTLYKGYIQELFHAHPRVKALESLLYERPNLTEGTIPGRSKEQVFPKLSASKSSAGNTHFETPLTPVPVTQLLSNGNYSIMVTNSGSGYSKYQNIDITRWRVDVTCDNWGSCFYIKDMERNAFFSAASYPTASLGSSYAVNFSNSKVNITKKDLGIEASTDIVVSPEDNVEIRCTTLTNQALRSRLIEMTSYIEIALAEHKADLMHPAFSKMFIETEAVNECEGLIAQRRKRSDDAPEQWCFHIAALDTKSLNPFSFETRRDIFIGSNRSLANPEKISSELTNSQGYVLDPIFSLRKKIRIDAGKQAKISFITGFAHSREEAMRLMNKYKNIEASKRALDMAWTHAELDLRRLHITHDDAHLFQRLANFMIYPDPLLRAPGDVLKANRYSQDKLWGHGISGDNPILLVSIEDIYNLEVVHSALLAHAFWSMRGLKTDVVIVNKEKTSYDKPLNEHLIRVMQAYAQYTGINRNGGIFLVEAEKTAPEDLNLIYTVASAILVAERGSLSQQLALPRKAVTFPPLLKVDTQIKEEPSAQLPFMELLYFNGIGGFTQDGKEYAMFYEHGKTNMAPWINAVSNKNFGFLASGHGMGMTWDSNSQMNRLTPWSNDATLNPITDVCYIRDDETGKYWTVASSPILENDAFRTRHGNGYTIYEHNSHAIEQEVTVFVPLDEEHTPVRIQIIKLRNSSSRTRKLSVFTYAELVLGQNKEESQRYIESQWNYETNTLMAMNYYRPVFADKVAFISSSPAPVSYTASRKDFIGRNQTSRTPDALKRTKLSQRVGGAMDPCFALQTTVELYPNETTEIVVVFGECSDVSKAKRICRHYQDINNAHLALDNAKQWWDKLLSRVQVQTPDQSLDLLFNRWLTYQNLSCRMWGRSAFYQSGGAYGFRDQLQDAAALVYLDPAITKEQIIRAAGRQFIEGDVQHWWHVETNSGVRTHISDDLLWLPYVTMLYVQVTHDESIMDIEIPYLEGRLLNEGEHEAIVIPTQSEKKGTVREHCLKAIEKSMAVGPHGLPLIGGGDWNDGMNLVGKDGKGESVWLAWFFIYVLKEFSVWLETKQDTETANYLMAHARNLLNAIEDNAWDGAWYIRAFFDDGTPVGSHLNAEDKIDSLPQSWAVINGQDNERVKKAMDSVNEYLIDEINKLILLFTPPFDKAKENPGYIKGYPPGVRENGGQYTHAAVWVAMAFAKRGDGDRAMQLLSMINPINRTKTLEDVYHYRVEPYVLCADIYALPKQEGLGGWTWYTGSASLMYRTILEDVIGFKLSNDVLVMDPCIPKDWNDFTLTYWHGDACYEIRVENPQHISKGVARVELDGQLLQDAKTQLVRSNEKHYVKVIMG